MCDFSESVEKIVLAGSCEHPQTVMGCTSQRTPKETLTRQLIVVRVSWPQLVHHEIESEEEGIEEGAYIQIESINSGRSRGCSGECD